MKKLKYNKHKFIKSTFNNEQRGNERNCKLIYKVIVSENDNKTTRKN